MIHSKFFKERKFYL